jgi:hypothetical protein
MVIYSSTLPTSSRCNAEQLYRYFVPKGKHEIGESPPKLALLSLPGKQPAASACYLLQSARYEADSWSDGQDIPISFMGPEISCPQEPNSWLNTERSKLNSGPHTF